MTERPLSRLYLPWLSWLVVTMGAVILIGTTTAAAVLISSHQFRGLMRLLVVILLVLIATAVVLVRYRSRFDQFIQTDGETFVRFWSPSSDFTIERSVVSSISVSDREVVIEGPAGIITVDRRYPEFESLRKILEGWRSSAGKS